MNKESIIKIVASIENYSEHPIAKSIVAFCKKKDIKINTKEVSDFENIAGYGIKAKYKQDQYLIGNKLLMKENNVDLNLAEKHKVFDYDELQNSGNSILFVAKNNKLISLIGMMDTVRENAKEAISKLKDRKIEIVMLTGDNEKTAKSIANKIGIKHVIAGVLPKQKSEEIKKLKEKGLVMMCGDGINDSISLVTADIGVSVGSGTDIAMDSSDVVLIKNNLDKIDKLISISKKTIRIIKQNLFWAFFYNICMLPIAAGILVPFGIEMNPMFAAFSMTISSITVTLNSLRIR